MRHGQAGDGELDAVDGGGGHRVRCGVLWNCRRWRGRRQPAPQGSGGDLLQVAVAAGVADQAPQGEAQQVGRGDHLCQVSSEGGGGIEPVGTVGAALEDDLNSGAVDLNVGDGAALLGGEGAEDGGGSGGHEVRLRVLENYSVWGDPVGSPWRSCHNPIESGIQGVAAKLPADPHGEGFSTVGDDIHPSDVGVTPDGNLKPQSAEGGDVGGVVSHRIGCGVLENYSVWVGHPWAPREDQSARFIHRASATALPAPRMSSRTIRRSASAPSGRRWMVRIQEAA